MQKPGDLKSLQTGICRFRMPFPGALAFAEQHFYPLTR